MKYSKDTHDNFVKLFFANNQHIGKTCKQIGITRQTYYEWLDTHVTFKQDIEAAKAEEIDFAENQLLIMAEGIPEIEIVEDENGNKIEKRVGWVVQPNMEALKLLLKRDPKRGYNDKIFNINQNINTDITGMDEEEVKARLAELDDTPQTDLLAKKKKENDKKKKKES